MSKEEKDKKEQDPIILDAKPDELLKWLQSEHDKAKEEEEKKGKK